MEQSPGQRRHQMEHCTHASRRLPHDGDVGLVPAEGADVLLDPVQGQDLVVHAKVAGGVVRLQIEEAQGTKSGMLRPKLKV